MEKVGAYTERVTGAGEWRPGNPATGERATPMLSNYFNMLQRELVYLVESAGIELDVEDDQQITQAIMTMIAAAIGALPDPVSLPVGSILPCPSTTPWDGFYLADGSLLTRADDPDLWAYADGSGNIVDEVDWTLETSGSFSRGDGSTNFRLPDLRGVALRGFDGGRGLDIGRVLGTYQADENKEHSHAFSGNGAWIDSGGSFIVNAGGSNVNMARLTSSALSGGSEARMKNTAINFCIKY